jgi:tetratricopeptide (TPR) repeat protein
MYTEMIALAPDSFRGYSNLGGMYLFQGRYGDAIPQFQRSISIYPTGDAYSNLGVAYFLQGDYSNAAQTYQRALQVSPQDATAYMIWGNLAEATYWLPDQRSQAAALYEKAIALARDQLKINTRDAYVLMHLALYNAMLQRNEQALDYLKRALALPGQDAEVPFLAAKVHAQLGNKEEALSFLETAVHAGYSVFFVRDDPIFHNLATNMHFEKLIGKPS